MPSIEPLSPKTPQLSVKTLQRYAACGTEVGRFLGIFGDTTKVTRTLAKKHVLDFEVIWALRLLRADSCDALTEFFRTESRALQPKARADPKIIALAKAYSDYNDRANPIYNSLRHNGTKTALKRRAQISRKIELLYQRWIHARNAIIQRLNKKLTVELADRWATQYIVEYKAKSLPIQALGLQP